MLLAFCLALVLCTMCAQRAQAGIITLNDFTLTNTNGDGSAITTAGGSTLIFTGPNNGSGLPGQTDLTTVAKASGLVQFDFSYTTLDLWDTSDPTATPNDFAGYLAGSVFTLLADRDGQSGTVSFQVVLGQTFGFRIGTVDNVGEPGVLTISNYTAPGGGANVPEPGTSSLMLLAGGASLAAVRIRRAAARRKENQV